MAIDEGSIYIVVTTTDRSRVVSLMDFISIKNRQNFYCQDVLLLPICIYIAKHKCLLIRMQEYNQILLLFSTIKSSNTFDFYVLLLNSNLAILWSQQLVHNHQCNQYFFPLSNGNITLTISVTNGLCLSSRNMTYFYSYVHQSFQSAFVISNSYQRQKYNNIILRCYVYIKE